MMTNYCRRFVAIGSMCSCSESLSQLSCKACAFIHLCTNKCTMHDNFNYMFFSVMYSIFLWNEPIESLSQQHVLFKFNKNYSRVLGSHFHSSDIVSLSRNN